MSKTVEILTAVWCHKRKEYYAVIENNACGGEKDNLEK